MKALLLTIFLTACTGSMCYTPCSNVVTQIEQQDGVFECEIMSACTAQWDKNFEPLNSCEINRCAVEYFKLDLECRQYISELMQCLSRNNCMRLDCRGQVNPEMDKRCGI